MKIADALTGVGRLAVETAPFIYYVERHATYVDKMRAIFVHVNQGRIEVITSTVTLTEVLTKPLKAKDHILIKNYREMLQTTGNILLVPINAPIAESAADFRARYNLKTPDALQVATAIYMHCDAFLTNDLGLKRVNEISVLILDELTES